jgi:hypothetical protein
MSNDFNSLFLSNNAGTGPSVPTAAGEGVSRYINREGVEHFENDKYASYEESAAADAKRNGEAFQITDSSGRVVRPGSGGVDPSMRIKLPNGDGTYIETTIAVGLMQGLITKNQDGSYHVDERDLGMDKTPREEAPKAPSGEFMADRGAENLVEVLARDVNPGDAIGVINDLLEGGAVNVSLLGNVASQLGVQPREAAGYIDRITAGFTVQAESTVAKITGGVASAEDIWAWARENDPQALKDAMRSQITARSTAGYKSIAKAFMGQLDSHQPQVVMDAAHAAGLEPTWDSRSRQIILTLPDGRTMPYRQAVMLGIINLSATR